MPVVPCTDLLCLCRVTVELVSCAQCRKEHKELRLRSAVPQLIIVLFSVQMINCSTGYRLSGSGAG